MLLTIYEATLILMPVHLFVNPTNSFDKQVEIRVAVFVFFSFRFEINYTRPIVLDRLSGLKK